VCVIVLVKSGLCAFCWELISGAEIQVYFLSQEPNLSAVKLSHKLEYACRVLAQLARSHGQETLAHIDELAEAEKIPANYLVQILNELRNAGLIISKRGKQGGYALSRAPERIRLTEIVAAVDGELLERNFDEAGHSGDRVASIWSDIGVEFEKKIGSYTLEAFVVEDSNDMYYI
jgi:Rrf2 family cysteine metabolism transcriptional repressor